MTGIRVINMKMLYIKGFPFEFKKIKHLKGAHFFGYYGSVNKIKFATESLAFNNTTRRILSVFVTFENEISALKAIMAMNGLQFNELRLSASFGRNKYCHFFLKRQ